MLNRATNLLVLFIATMALLTLSINIETAWRNTLPWHQDWSEKPNVTPKHTAKELLHAMKNAESASDHSAVYKLEEALEAWYEPSGNVHVRFTISEALEALTYFFITLLFLIIPISINYVRHGAFRFWNRAPNKSSQPTPYRGG